ncbi:hypothetical protein ABH931_007438 [Streptacidiphilus sp. MAP12-33]|uniref:hypothetical protein n=1 Tax=Streptacidiphilus sp. MAP12-33 TaxID=3156266 RepID=UPI0035196B26
MHLDDVDPDDGDWDDDPEATDEENGEPYLLIRSQHFKSATDPDTGNHLPSGAERAVPWVAITPVVTAIRLLEQLVPAGALLFGSGIHDPNRTQHRTRALGVGVMSDRIEDLVAWASAEAAEHDLPGEVIPPDPSGRIGTARFRRTLAWHIARRPGGLVALAIQYGHLRTALDTDESGRYGSRSRHGIHHLLDLETALATADAAADLHERFQEGEGVSGPAARQALRAAAATKRLGPALVTAGFARKHTLAKQHLARDGAVLHDNPHALLLCLFRADRALCAKDGPNSQPTLHACVPGCANTIRTDKQAAALRRRATQLEAKAFRTPAPIAQRLHANAVRLRAWADDHDRTRITHQENPA